MIEIAKIKQDFPIFQTHLDLVYLDSAATSQKPRAVVEAVSNYYKKNNANIHRGIYKLAETATAEYEAAREKVRRFINAADSREIVFTRNATEAINLVAQTWGCVHLDERNTVLISGMEHHANIVPWQLIKGMRGKDAVEGFRGIEIVKLTNDFRLDLDDLKKKLQERRVALVAVTHASNVLGTINPIKKIAKLAHEYGALVLIDGAQAVPHVTVDMQDLGADFYVFSGHKMLGPTGTGALYARADLLEQMPPYQGGGEMIKKVTSESSRWNDLPWKFEAGTPNIAGVIGLGAAIDYLNNIRASFPIIPSKVEESPTHVGAETTHTREIATLPSLQSNALQLRNDKKNDPIYLHEQELGTYTLEQLSKVDGLTLYGPSTMKNRVAAFSFTLDGTHAHDVAQVLDESDIAIRAGHHCAMPLHDEILKVSATARASLYIYNSKEDIDKLIIGLEQAKEVLAKKF